MKDTKTADLREENANFEVTFTEKAVQVIACADGTVEIRSWNKGFGNKSAWNKVYENWHKGKGKWWRRGRDRMLSI